MIPNALHRIVDSFLPNVRPDSQLNDQKEMVTERLRGLMNNDPKAGQQSRAQTLDDHLAYFKATTPEAYEEIRKGTLTFGESGTLFHLVAEKGTSEEMRVLRTHFPEMEAIKDEGGRNLLMAAAKGDNTDVIEFLLDGGANPNEKNSNNGWTALIWAAFSNATNAIKALLGSSSGHMACNINETNLNNQTALLVAIQSGSIPAARLLLNAGAANDVVDDRGWNALMWAAQLKDPGTCLNAIELLNPSAADFQKCDAEKRNPLGIAIAEGTVANMRTLLAAGANPNSAGSEKTAFGAAISLDPSSDRLEKVRLIMAQQGFDANAKGAGGNTAVTDTVEIALFQPDKSLSWTEAFETIETLIIYKDANPDIKNDKGYSAKDWQDHRGMPAHVNSTLRRLLYGQDLGLAPPSAKNIGLAQSDDYVEYD